MDPRKKKETFGAVDSTLLPVPQEFINDVLGGNKCKMDCCDFGNEVIAVFVNFSFDRESTPAHSTANLLEKW